MILVDTGVWIDHFHTADPSLSALLEASLVCIHPMITGELALGAIRERSRTLALFDGLEPVPTASHDEVRHLVEAHRLDGRGLSLVDAHLLASLRLTGRDKLWTRDKRLRAAAEQLGVAARLDDDEDPAQ